MAATEPWTTGDIATLRKLAHLGVAAVAAELGRSPTAVKSRAHLLGISLRPAGERRGLVIGETRRARLPAPERTAVLYGPSNGERAARRARSTAELCPLCGYRQIETADGTCEVCHIRRLTHAHREEAVTIAAHRDLVAARQAKHKASIR